MTEPSRRLVRRVVETFGSGDADAVLGLLRAVEDPFGHAVSERVHAAIVIVGNGDLRRLADAAHLATVDWRDVLVAAELAGDDWRLRLDDYLGDA